jgi:hypothetical protein
VSNAFDASQPWVRQPFDGDLEWALFQDFLGLSSRPRNVRELVKKGAPVSVKQLELIAWEKAWNARAALWDKHLDQIRVKAIETEVAESAKDVARRHQRGAKKLLALVEQELEKYHKASSSTEMPGILTPKDIIRGLFVGVRTERMVLGEASERLEGSVDLSGLSAEELRTLRDLQLKAKAIE